MTGTDLLSGYRKVKPPEHLEPVGRILRGHKTSGLRRTAPPGRRSLSRALGIALIGMVLAGGCAEKDPDRGPVALTVGGTHFYLDEFETAFRKYLDEQGAPADTSSLRAFVPVYVDQALLEVIAAVEIPELPPGPAERLEDHHERAMIEALHRKEFGEAFDVSRQALERAYERLGRRLRLRYMFVHDIEDAEQIISTLKQGAAFGPLALAESKDDRSRDSGGDLGWLDYYDLPMMVRDPVFSLPLDGIGGPYPWSTGYQIFKVVDEKENPARGTLEAERERLEAEIRGIAVSRARREFEENLLRKYRYTVDPVEVTWMTAFLRDRTSSFRRFGEPEPVEEEDPLEPEKKAPWTSNPIPEADRDRALATINVPEGVINPAHVLDQLITLPAIGWPRFHDNRDVEKLLREVALIWLQPRDAMAQGLDKDPQVIREIQEREREIRNRVFYRTEVRAKSIPSDDEIRASYEANLDRYHQPERRRFVAIGSSSRDNAVMAAELMRQGLSVEQVQARLAPKDDSIEVIGGEGTPLLAYGTSPMLDDVLFRLPPGGVSDPIPVGQSFTVAKVLEIVAEGPQPYEEVFRDMRREISQARADSLLQALLDSRRDEFQVEINWDAVWQARLEAPK